MHELERELAETAALRQRGGKAGAALRHRPARPHRPGRVAVLRRRPQGGPTPRPRCARPCGWPRDNYGALRLTRQSVDNGTAVMVLVTDVVYGGLADALLAVADAVPGQIEDIELKSCNAGPVPR